MGKEVLVEAYVFGNRLIRERDTIEKMIILYCRAKHLTEAAICSECQELLSYAAERLNYCKFGEHKPVCAKCPIHCYRKDMRVRVVEVMRYAGPRMIWRQPSLALLHILDGFRKA